MRLIDADKFLAYLIYSKHIDSLTCGEVKEVIKMCEVDVLDKISAEIQKIVDEERTGNGNINKGVVIGLQMALDTVNRYKAEGSDKE